MKSRYSKADICVGICMVITIVLVSACLISVYETYKQTVELDNQVKAYEKAIDEFDKELDQIDKILDSSNPILLFNGGNLQEK